MIRFRSIVPKLDGLYELRRFGSAGLDWQEYSDKLSFDSETKYSVRCANFDGCDFGLPRAIGITGDMVSAEANKFLQLHNVDFVFVYPWFKALLSGTLITGLKDAVSEIVFGDLWNLTDGEPPDTTVDISRDALGFGTSSQTTNVRGSLYCMFQHIVDWSSAMSFVLRKLESLVDMIQRRYFDYIIEGHQVYIEWSLALKPECSSALASYKIEDCADFVVYEFKVI